MKTKHTPGSWTIRHYVIAGGEGGVSHYTIIGGPDRRAIVRTVNQVATSEDEANVELLVKAPKMYALLTWAIERWGPAVNSGRPIIGSNAVEWLGEFVRTAQTVIKEE